jgi:hypothetical protein
LDGCGFTMLCYTFLYPKRKALISMASQLIKETETEYIYADTYQFTVPKMQISAADLPAEGVSPSR